MTNKEADELQFEYLEYMLNDKHALPFKIWLKHKKKFNEHQIQEIYTLLRLENKDGRKGGRQ